MCHLYHYSFPSCAHISPLSPLPCLILTLALDSSPEPKTPRTTTTTTTTTTATATPSLTSGSSNTTGTVLPTRQKISHPWNHPARIHAPTTPTSVFFSGVEPAKNHATSSHDLGDPGYPCPLCASRGRGGKWGGEVKRDSGGEHGGSRVGKVERWLHEDEEDATAGVCGTQDPVAGSRQESGSAAPPERVGGMPAGVGWGREGRGVGTGAMRGVGFGFGAGRMQRQHVRARLWAQRVGERGERGGGG
ncbi:hypothetical protein MMC15_007203 [Xylographa vitiligo]|nr:hypothetical protein [Xylographa vitiligo]